MRQTLGLEIQTTGAIDISPDISSDAFEDGRVLCLKGEVIQIKIKKDGEAYVGIYIKEDGSLVISNYNTFFSTDVPRQLILNNDRPWKKE